MLYSIFIDPYRKTPVALSPEQLAFLIETQTHFGDKKQKGLWLTAFENAVTVEASSPSEAEEIWNSQTQYLGKEKHNVGRI